MYMCCVYVCPTEVRRQHGVMDSCKLPWGCRELNLDLLQEQQEILTPESTLHPIYVLKYMEAIL